TDARTAAFDWRKRGLTFPGLLIVVTYTSGRSRPICSAIRSLTPCQLVVLVISASTFSAFIANCSAKFAMLIPALLSCRVLPSSSSTDYFSHRLCALRPSCAVDHKGPRYDL